MARIRSVHPGFFADEGIVSCGPWARLLLIGIYTEADDKGIFEWKPLTIKMRVFPADAHDVPAIEGMLGELAAADMIRPFEVDGSRYGAIKNFRRWQRPQRPNDLHPITDELRKYVRLDASIPQQVHDNSANGSGKSFQREEGRGKRKKNTSMGKGTSEIVDADGVLHDHDDPVWRNHDEVRS